MNLWTNNLLTPEHVLEILAKFREAGATRVVLPGIVEVNLLPLQPEPVAPIKQEEPDNRSPEDIQEDLYKEELGS